MTRDEVKNIVMVISATYPNFRADNKSVTVDAWNFAIGDYSYGLMQRALKAFMTTDASGFPPTPGQLVEQAMRLTEPEELGGMEAWSLVSKALRNCAYNSEQEFSKLPPLVQKAVGSAASLREMALMDTNTVNSVEQSHFIRTYTGLVNSKSSQAKLPQTMQQEMVDGRILDGGEMTMICRQH